MSNDSLKGFYGDQALSPHEAEHETPLNKPLTKSFEIQTSQSVNRGNVNRNFQKRMSVTGHIDQLKRTIESNFKECQQQLMDKMCKMYDEIHKNWKDESQKIVEEHKEEQQQIQEKIHLKEEVQQLKEEVQQLKEQHNHLIESDPMSTVVKVSWIFTLVYVSLTFIDSIVCKRIVAKVIIIVPTSNVYMTLWSCC